MRRQRGFTLVELMVVVAIFSIIAGLAVMSIGRTNRGGFVDGFTNDVRTAITQARRRAVSTRNVFLVVVTANTVRYCQVTNTPDAALNFGAIPTTCPQPAGPGPYWEASSAVYAGPGVSVTNWSQDVDVGQGAVPVLAMPALLYFFPDGSVDSNLATPPPSLQGFTLRVQSSSEATVKRKLFVYALGGRPRITDSW